MDKPIKDPEEINVDLEFLKAKASRLMKSLKGLVSHFPFLQTEDEEKKETKHPGSKKVYNFDREKTRRKMAAKSNRINRTRIKRWKF